MKRLFQNNTLSAVLGRLKKIDSHRVLSFVLAVSMLISMVPSNIFAIFAVGNDADAANQNFGANIGNTAEFNDYFSSFPVNDDPTHLYWDTEYQVFLEDFPEGFLLVITDYYVHEDSGQRLLWYKVEAAPGHSLPEKLEKYPWVFQNYLGDFADPEDSLIIHKTGANFVFDAEGNPIDPEVGVSLPQYEKVSIRAESTLQGSVSYQWQICYDKEKDLWVDIYGENADNLNLSYGMVFSLLDENNTAYVRCKSTSGSKEAICAVIPITMVPYTGTIIENEFTTSEGNQVSVSVQGELPKDAELDLSETDAADVAIPGDDQFLLALDISIKNANGTQWQPASGETVVVDLPAAALNLSNGDYYAVYHVHNGQIQVLGPYLCDGESVCFEVGGFSKFVFTLIAPNTVSTDDYLSDIGKHAVVNAAYDYLWVSDDPFAIAEYTGTWFKTATIGDEDIVFEILDVYVSDVAPYALWYKVAAAPGYTLPDSIAQNPWVYQDYTAEGWTSIGSLDLFEQGPAEPAEPSVSVTVDGEVVTEITVSVSQKVTLSAAPSVEGSTTYQWQILIPSANMWVSVANQTSADCTVNYGMVANRLDADGKAYIRCVTTVDGQTITGEPIAVNIASARSPIARAGDDDLTIYNVIINYVFEDGSVAATPYTSTIGVTGNMTNTEKFPTVLGYLPYVNDVRQDEYQFNLKGSEMTGDFVLTVVYKPTLVDYTVVILQQNAENDDYTQVGSMTLQALTGSVVENSQIDITYPGFYQLLHEEATVAADGSTVIEVRYDRYYFLMTFELGEGGYGVLPVYARYGTRIEFGDPKRPGFVFQYWADPEGNIVTSPVSMPAYDIEITAVYSPGTTKYTVVYWRENADPNADGTYGYSFWGSEIRDSFGGSIVSGRDDIPQSITNAVIDGATVNEKQYFTYNDALTDKDIVVKGDGTTVVNVYYTRNYYTIYFTGYGKCSLTAHTHGTGCNSALICSAEEHTHTDACNRTLACNIPEHDAHTADCLSCGKVEHTAHTATCLACTHTHTIDCWSPDSTNSRDYLLAVAKPSQINENPVSGRVYSYTTGYFFNQETHYYLYFDGQWYCVYRTNNNGSTLRDTTEINSACTHTTHSAECYIDEIHPHSDSCYKDVIHTHIESCYHYGCGKVTHTHTNSCYSQCTLPVHTHGNNCESNRTDNVIYHITAKYQATIGDIWPTYDKLKEGGHAYQDNNGNVENNNNQLFYGWAIDNVSNVAASKRVNMTADLCDTSDGLKNASARYDADYTNHLYYMFESLDQSSPANGNDRRYYNGKYYDKSELYYQDLYSNSSSFGQKQIDGMTAVGTEQERVGNYNSTEYNNFLYYNRRNDIDLTYQSIDTVIDTKQNILYGAPLAQYEYDQDPPYPSTMEPGAYEFDGWYTTPECFDGTKVDFSTATMPNSNLTLYAKWAPVTHTVEFYKYKDDNGVYQEQIKDTYEVKHGALLNEQYIPESPKDFENGLYTFDGWFYMVDGTEQAFSFAHMAVTEDLKVYAKWKSNTLISYEIRFELGDGTQIADPITGSALAGTTRTFDAKGGEDLYVGYREGYFPNAQSHSLTMDINATDGMVYTFVYTKQDTVPYSVYYVTDKPKAGSSLQEVTLDGKTYYIVHETKTVNDNSHAYISENFEPVSGYMPDAYQKNLVVSPGADNKIVFYYTVDEEHAFYKVSHYTQNLDGTTWTEYYTYQSQGTIGSQYSEDVMTINGFTFDQNVDGTLIQGKLTAEGLHLKLYYTRNKYSYVVQYKDQLTGNILYTVPDLADQYYGQVVAHTAPGIYGNYDLVSNPTQTLTIRIEDDPNNPKLNIITFFYVERDVTIRYEVKGPEGSGTVSPDSETIKISSGIALGSTATASSDVYKFVGWYSDPECTIRVSTEAKYIPTKEEGALWTDAIYYAKFEYQITSLTIEKQVEGSSDRTFLFHIEGNGVDLYVTVKGNGSVTVNGLKVGSTYTVTEMTDWSWEYSFVKVENADGSTAQVVSVVDAAAEVKLGNGTNEIVFTNQYEDPDWLGGESSADNVFNDIYNP